jgi:hypothetical protein
MFHGGENSGNCIVCNSQIFVVIRQMARQMHAKKKLNHWLMWITGSSIYGSFCSFYKFGSADVGYLCFFGGRSRHRVQLPQTGAWTQQTIR